MLPDNNDLTDLINELNRLKELENSIQEKASESQNLWFQQKISLFEKMENALDQAQEGIEKNLGIE